MSRKPPPRDPNAPKRNLSAYLLYQNQMRETFKSQNPGMTFGQLSKYTSAMYAELNPDEKLVWVQHAEEDKKRYLHELANYNPPPGYDTKGDAIVSFLTQPTIRPSKGFPRDPKAPKRNLSAYLLYQNAMRNTFRIEYPAMTFGQLSKLTSEHYRKLSPEERKTWDDKAIADKERYEREMEKYSAPPGYDKMGVLIASREPGPRKYTKKIKDPNAPKRARGSYVFFTTETRPKILQEFPNIKFTDVGHIMGERWRALTTDQKKRYEELAQEDKKRFEEEMKAYKATLPSEVQNGHLNGLAQPNIGTEYDQDQCAQYYQNQYHTAAAFAHQQYMNYYAQQRHH